MPRLYKTRKRSLTYWFTRKKNNIAYSGTQRNGTQMTRIGRINTDFLQWAVAPIAERFHYCRKQVIPRSPKTAERFHHYRATLQ
jgi:hypothetical protein